MLFGLNYPPESRSLLRNHQGRPRRFEPLNGSLRHAARREPAAGQQRHDSLVQQQFHRLAQIGPSLPERRIYPQLDQALQVGRSEQLLRRLRAQGCLLQYQASQVAERRAAAEQVAALVVKVAVSKRQVAELRSRQFPQELGRVLLAFLGVGPLQFEGGQFGEGAGPRKWRGRQRAKVAGQVAGATEAQDSQFGSTDTGRDALQPFLVNPRAVE